jgi:PIN domain nuclease of toxin-antitoxin system
MRLLLDSHIFVWAKSAPSLLGDAVAAAIVAPQNGVFVSVASAWELWLKHARKPISPVLDGGADGFEAALAESGFLLLDISLEHAWKAASLPMHHRDPFDRMLIAQAIGEGMTLVSSDPEFEDYSGLSLLRV